ncbi:TPA: hypothetical protein QCX13_001556 [Bacillus toyonensis]|nr:hypothetical protein [Bacillus toyonensis]
MANEDIYLRTIKEMNLPLPSSSEKFQNIQEEGRLKEIKSVKGPGVYIINGDRNGVSETLYVGRTRVTTTHVGERVHKQLTQEDTFRKNMKKNGYTLYTNYQNYMDLKDTQKTVYISEVIILTFNKTKKDFLARDLSEILLIAQNDPYFNKEFAYLSEEERFDKDFKATYEKMTAGELSKEELVGMQIYNNRD